MTRREHILKALNFEETERPPMDLGAFLSSGISCFAYPGLVEALGLPARRPRLYDTYQMLAMPDTDVLDALNCDVVTLSWWGTTNAYDEPEKWHPYDFGGRLEAEVPKPSMFEVLDDGTVVQTASGALMPPQSHVFEVAHGGQPVDLMADLPKPDLRKMEERFKASLVTDERLDSLAELCRRVRESTDRAVLFVGACPNISIMAHGGIGIFPMLCMVEPDFVAELHELITHYGIQRIERLVPVIKDYVDILHSGNDDWGSQEQTLAPPSVYKELFLPYNRRINDTIHRHAPDMKTFLHSCGAIYEILDYIIEAGFDILNPVQWPAGGHSYQEWKDKCRNRITLWGGAVNAQETLPLGSADDVARETAEVVEYFKKDGGFVAAGIHNILAEIRPENILAMYRTAAGDAALQVTTDCTDDTDSVPQP